MEQARIPGPALCKLSLVYFSYYDVLLKRNGKILQWHEKYGRVVCIRPSWIHRRKQTSIASFFSKSSIHNLHRGKLDPGTRKCPIPADRYCCDRSFVTGHLPDAQLLRLRQCYQTSLRSPSLLPHHRKRLWERTILFELKQAQLWGPLHFNYPVLFNCLDRFLAFAGIHRGFLIAEHQLEAWTQQRVAAASAVAGSVNDYTLLGRMKGANDLDGKRMSFNYIAEELLDNTNAAQETATVALTYIVYHLGRNPEWSSKIREELLALPKLVDGYPSFANLDDAPILDSFIREVYRVNPGPSGRAERIVPAGGKNYAGFYLPGGVSTFLCHRKCDLEEDVLIRQALPTRVSASSVALHHNPSVFSAAAAFQPRRWTQADTQRLREMNASFIPFGYGARICLGMAFATIQIKSLTACLCISYRIMVDPNSKKLEELMRQAGTQDAIPRELRREVLGVSHKAL